MTDEPIVDAEAVEEPSDVTHDPIPASTSVVRRERRSEVIRPFEAGALVDSFKAYQDLLPRLLTDDDYQAADGKRFVKKSGWRKIATAFDLDVQIVRGHVDRDEHGQPVRAEVWARAIAPSGRSMDGDGYCSVDESRFAQARGRQKLENDLRTTATTRAMNRAISGLVGMGEVSAEEVDAGGHSSAPSWASPSTADQKKAALGALEDVIGDRDKARDYLKLLAEVTGGQLPLVVAAWITALPAWIAAGASTANEAAESEAATA